MRFEGEGKMEGALYYLSIFLALPVDFPHLGIILIFQMFISISLHRGI